MLQPCRRLNCTREGCCGNCNRFDIKESLAINSICFALALIVLSGNLYVVCGGELIGASNAVLIFTHCTSIFWMTGISTAIYWDRKLLLGFTPFWILAHCLTSNVTTLVINSNFSYSTLSVALGLALYIGVLVGKNRPDVRIVVRERSSHNPKKSTAKLTWVPATSFSPSAPLLTQFTFTQISAQGSKLRGSRQESQLVRVIDPNRMATLCSVASFPLDLPLAPPIVQKDVIIAEEGTERKVEEAKDQKR